MEVDCRAGPGRQRCGAMNQAPTSFGWEATGEPGQWVLIALDIWLEDEYQQLVIVLPMPFGNSLLFQWAGLQGQNKASRDPVSKLLLMQVGGGQGQGKSKARTMWDQGTCSGSQIGCRECQHSNTPNAYVLCIVPIRVLLCMPAV